MHVTFTKDFDFSPAARNGHVTIAYKAGTEENVTRECVKAAAAAGAIERTAEIDALLAEEAAEKAGKPPHEVALEQGIETAKALLDEADRRG